MARDEAFLDEHIAMLRDVYRERRDLMLATMDEHFPAEVTWTRPEGGLFLMVTLPPHLDASEILKTALNRMWHLCPARAFTSATRHNTFRLNYSNARPEMIVEGIKRLGMVLKDEVQKPR